MLEEAPELRARIIDFELRHLPTLPAADRHADDLAGFLLDMLGRIDATRWLPCAAAFLEGYDRPEINAVLRGRLRRAPASLGAWLWRQVQIGFLRRAEYERRLRDLLDLAAFQPAPSVAPVRGCVASTHSVT